MSAVLPLDRVVADATRRQHMALDGAVSVWASANAGTGKTTVLIRRLLRLLLTDPTLLPQHILALSFTNAAAAEMAERFAALVRTWATYDDDTLRARARADLDLNSPHPLAPRMAEIAVQVALEGPMFGTIHALAQQVLARMPMEAGLVDGFTLMDKGAQDRLLRDVQDTLLMQADGEIAGYLGTLLDELGERGWDDLTRLMIGAWDKLDAVLADGSLPDLMARLDAALDLPPDAVLFAPQVPDVHDEMILRRVVAAFPEANVGHDAAAILRAQGARREELWVDFLVVDSQKNVRKRILDAAQKKALGEDAFGALMTAGERVLATLKGRHAARGRTLTEALLVWAHYVRATYHARKTQLGAVDFHDLLTALTRVFAAVDSGDAAWLWHQMDRSFRHIVVDEAQDNNARQGEVVAWLTRNVLAGDRGDGPRSALAVGDMKQSIFRFQGAIPENFTALRALLQAWGGDAFRTVALDTTFRNGAAIVELVDAVLAPLAAEILGDTGDAGDVWPGHITAAIRPSRVELWPRMAATKADVAPWALPEDRHAAAGARTKVAVATQLAAWLSEQYARGVVLPSTQRPLAWADVMVVVQKNDMAGLVAGVLAQHGIPVQATRGISLPVVDDMVALLRWVFDPADRVALVQVLRAFYGWSDDRVMRVAHGATELLHVRLTGVEEADMAMFGAMRTRPPAALVQAAVVHYGLDMHVLAPLMGWAEHAPDLRTLIVKLEREDLPTPTTHSTGVRVLTVHGAKGLEAPLVILPETQLRMDDISKDKLLWGDDLVLFKQGEDISALEDDLITAEKKRRRADALRGLYVAMTRAKDWLVVMGWEGQSKNKGETWYEVVAEGIGRLPAVRHHAERMVVGDDFDEAARDAQAKTLETPAAPVWLGRVADDLPPPAPLQTPEQVWGEWAHAALQGAPLRVPADMAARLEATVARVRTALPWIFDAPHYEVPLAVESPAGTRLGRADVVVWRGDVCWILDFKTGTPCDPVPDAYRTQVCGYMAAARRVWPHATLKGGIVWVDTAVLVEVHNGDPRAAEGFISGQN